jgi:hypothetical protein
VVRFHSLAPNPIRIIVIAVGILSAGCIGKKQKSHWQAVLVHFYSFRIKRFRGKLFFEISPFTFLPISSIVIDT